MGFFDWLAGGKSNTEVRPDKIWMHTQAKYEGIAREVAQALASDEPPSAVYLVAHFPDGLAALQALMDRIGLATHLVHCILADKWTGRVAEAPDDSRHILIVVCERHP